VISRHKAVERSRAAINWGLEKFVPLGFVARFVNNHILVNDDKAMIRWIQIRNSYHRFVLEQFQNSDKLLVVNIENELMADEIGAFLSLEKKLEPVWKNQEGDGSITARVLNAIGNKRLTVDSEGVVDGLFQKHGIEQHTGCLTFFEHRDFLLSKSGADKFLVYFPFFKGLFKWLFLYFVRRRGGSKSYSSKVFNDSMIKLFRSEMDLNYYTSIYHFGSGSR
jgi:hypothetical protein